MTCGWPGGEILVALPAFSLPEWSSDRTSKHNGHVVIIKGILGLHVESIQKLLNMKISVDTDDDLRLARR